MVESPIKKLKTNKKANRYDEKSGYTPAIQLKKRYVFSFHNFDEYVRQENYQKLYGLLFLGFKSTSPNPNFLKFSKAHKHRKRTFLHH
jgi:hypothetical protein